MRKQSTKSVVEAGTKSSLARKLGGRLVPARWEMGTKVMRSPAFPIAIASLQSRRVPGVFDSPVLCRRPTFYHFYVGAVVDGSHLRLFTSAHVKSSFRHREIRIAEAGLEISLGDEI